MKYLSLVALIFFIKFSVFGQSDHSSFAIAEQMPMFPGCEEIADYQSRMACSQKKMLEFIYSNIQYPKEAKENGIEGMVVVKFVVRRDSSLTDIEVLRALGGGCSEESVRVVESMPKWHPGIYKGEPANVQFNLPIRFKLEDPEPKKKKRRRGS